MNKTKSPLKWIGGKSRLADWIIGHFPEHQCYVEPFGGGCNVIAAKPNDSIEIVNDINGDLVNFLMLIKDHVQKDKLINDLLSTPYSQKLYEEYKWSSPEGLNNYDRAFRFFYIVRNGFSGGGHKYKTGWSCSKSVDKAANYISAAQNIESFAKRMLQVNIACEDFEKVIDRYDGPRTLFYIDSPYVDCEDLYSGGFRPEDHKRLSERLHRIQGKAIVNYYENDLTNDLYIDWWTDRKKTYSTIQAAGDGAKRPDRVEILYMNFEPMQEKQLQLVLG